MPDDHSEVVPLLPIPNRTVKRLCANDSADPRVKVGHRQASYPNAPSIYGWGVFTSRFTDSESICENMIQYIKNCVIIEGSTDCGGV